MVGSIDKEREKGEGKVQLSSVHSESKGAILFREKQMSRKSEAASKGEVCGMRKVRYKGLTVLLLSCTAFKAPKAKALLGKEKQE